MRQQQKFWSIAILMVFAILLIVPACGNPSASQTTGASSEPTSSPATETSQPSATPQQSAAPTATVKVGIICGTMTPLLAVIGMNDGSFEKAGIHIEKACFNSGADAVQALVGGSIDINLGSYEHVLRTRKNNLNIKAYAEIYNGLGYELITKKDAPYQKLSDLKKTTLGVTKVGSLSDTGLKLILQGEKIDPQRDVKIIGSGAGATMQAAIQSGKVAAGMVPEPTASQMIASGDYRVLDDPSINYAGIVVMSNADWVDKNKETMKSFLKVLHDVRDNAQSNPSGAVAALAKEFTQVPQDVLEAAFKKQLDKVPSDLKVTKEGADSVIQSQIELGSISKTIPFEQTIDLSLLP